MSGWISAGPQRSLQAQIEEVDYEIAMRERVYRSFSGRKAREAGEHMLRMQCVRETLIGLQEQAGEPRR